VNLVSRIDVGAQDVNEWHPHSLTRRERRRVATDRGRHLSYAMSRTANLTCAGTPHHRLLLDVGRWQRDTRRTLRAEDQVGQGAQP
jgi:hypothetical protein